jgi:hypothetical protein
VGAALRRPRAATVIPALAAAGGSAVAVIVGIYLSTRTSFTGVQLVGVGLFAALTAWMAATKHVLWALGALLLYIGLLDGVLKLKAANELPTIGRDVLLYAVVAGMAARAKLAGKRFTLPVFGGWAIAWTALVIVELANPLGGNLAHSIASTRQHIEFVPLLFVGYYVLREERHLRLFLGLLLTVAALNGAVGAYQSTMSPEQLAGWGKGYYNLINGIGSAPRTAEGADGKKRVRPPGLGSDMGFAGILGATAIPGGLALLLLPRRRFRYTLLIGVGLVGAVAGLLTSQSRSALVSAAVMVIAFLGLTAIAGQAKKSFVALLAVGVVGIGAVYAVSSHDSNAFYRYKSIAPTKAVSTTLDSRESTWSLIPKYASEVPFGAGLGSVGPAAGFLDDLQVKYNAESQFTFLIVELGVPGLLIFLCFQASIVLATLTGLRRVDGRIAVLLAAVAAPLFGYMVNWLVGVNTVSSPNAPYMWLAAGLIGWWLVAMPRQALERRRQDSIAQRAVVPVHA